MYGRIDGVDGAQHNCRLVHPYEHVFDSVSGPDIMVAPPCKSSSNESSWIVSGRFRLQQSKDRTEDVVMKRVAILEVFGHPF